MLTGCGAPGARGIVQCLRLNGERGITIIGTDIREENPGALLVDMFYRVPRPISSDFIPIIQMICKDNQVSVILPLVTKELTAFSYSRVALRLQGINVPISSIEVLSVANNKARLLEVLWGRLPIPRFYVVKSLSAFKHAVSSLGFPEKAVCFKPPSSNGSRGFRILNESIDQLDLLLNRKPTNVYISYNALLLILEKASREDFPELVVMEYLPGPEYSVDMLVDNGHPIYTIPRRRNVITAGISTVCTTEHNTKVITYCNCVAEALGLHGNIGMQVKADEHGCYELLEINPRLQGSTVLCCKAGVNLPYLGVKLALGEPIPRNFKVRWGLRMHRIYNEVYFQPQKEHDEGES